ncbi:MAG: SelL-related redox protein [Saprospiraceae bacterium]
MIYPSVGQQVLKHMLTDGGSNVLELSQPQPLMLIFLRHFGCTFCREALSDIANLRPWIEQTGTRVAFVHMTDFETASKYLNRYNLQGIPHISDPECRFYATFGLMKGNANQLFGLQSLIRGFQVGIVKGNGFNFHQQLGDGFQMPGVFILHEGVIKDGFIHKLSHDRPDYKQLVSSCCDL